MLLLRHTGRCADDILGGIGALKVSITKGSNIQPTTLPPKKDDYPDLTSCEG